MREHVFEAVSEALGPEVRGVDCRITFADGRAPLHADAFDWARDETNDGAITLRGACDGLTATWSFAPWNGGAWVTLTAESGAPIHCAALCNLIADYAPTTGDLGAWWAPNFGDDVHTVGLHRVRELDGKSRTDKVLRGAFPNAHDPGLFMGTRFPQTHEHWYSAERVNNNALRFSSATRFRPSIGAQIFVVSEATWACVRKTARSGPHQFACTGCRRRRCTQLREMLGPQSNLVRFQRQGYLFPLPAELESTLYFIFWRMKVDPNTAPRDTRLRRAILDHLQAGKPLRSGGFFLLRDDVSRFSEEPYQKS